MAEGAEEGAAAQIPLVSRLYRKYEQECIHDCERYVYHQQ